MYYLLHYKARVEEAPDGNGVGVSVSIRFQGVCGQVPESGLHAAAEDASVQRPQGLQGALFMEMSL